ncbi:hypothetical protein LSTR_LSTR002799 [Laodelphax striatellus]|uniref:Complex III subunit 9 n=1 Tax=Laodelphax striatellus TaxID=195883 RepID=A0A482XHH4_LAOST|nr:hypothetical protein LSTR_LSTR002799 [Laodelphax striatellus]
MSFNKALYNNIFRRSSTFALTICVSAFFFERAFDMGTEAFFRNYNKGKLFDDIIERSSE